MKSEIVKFPKSDGTVGALGYVWQMHEDSDSFHWRSTYSDGSGHAGGWCLSKRGAKICAITACRNFSRNYKASKYKWIANPTLEN